MKEDKNRPCGGTEESLMELLSKYDANMATDIPDEIDTLRWYDVRRAPFALHGLYEPLIEPYFHRMPDAVGDAVSEGVSACQKEDAGARVRFSTDSPVIAVRAKFRTVGRSSHLTLVSSAGFDLYADGEYGSRYVREFRMDYQMEDRYAQLVHPHETGMRAYTVCFPVHSSVETLEIGLAPDAQVGPERPYRGIGPVVFYGSSIVHGTGATRPSMIYTAQISRRLNIDYLNLGFSGQAKGEQAMAKYIAQLPMSVFVCDYDHNACDPAALRATHYPFYETIRAARPDLPYVMISCPTLTVPSWSPESVLERRDVVMESYLRARKNGDRNVYFIDGLSFFTGDDEEECTLDHVHPNDVGHMYMARAIGGALRNILGRG